MDLRNGNALSTLEMTSGLIRALQLAIDAMPVQDGQRDRIVSEIERAMEAITRKATMTNDESRIVEEMENLVLRLRVKGISAVSKPRLARTA